MKQDLIIATGTRADWGLLRPLAVALRETGISLGIWATNMHANPLFGDSIDEIRKDGFTPELIAPYKESPEEMMAVNCTTFAKRLRSHSPRGIVILGDRIEMLGVASAALLTGVPIIHIAGGTISEGAVDDAIRNSISQMATLHLTETETTGARLHTFGLNVDHIHVCGALGVYNALQRALIPRKELEEQLRFSFGDTLIVATLHAATRASEDEQPLTAMQNMLAALALWLEESDRNRVILTWPNNDVDPKPQIEAMERFHELYPQQSFVIPSLGALKYLSAVALSKGVIGNSSSGLVEVPSLKVPTLDIGSRQKGRECGDSVWHVGPESEEIIQGIHHILSPAFVNTVDLSSNPYEKPDTPAMMAKIISDFIK